MTDPIDDTHPIDETHPHPAAPPDPRASDPGPAAATPEPPAPMSPATADDPPLRVDPTRTSDPNWREPAWFPPRDDRGRSRDHRSGTFAILVGLLLIAVGAWYFLEGTLGIALPRIRWGSLWPVLLIVIGGLILLRSIQRRT